MAPKKAPAETPAAKGGETDFSCETFFKGYRKNCQTMGVEMSVEIKKLVEEEWQTNNKPITKVTP
jgi:hypothetical protein